MEGGRLTPSFCTGKPFVSSRILSLKKKWSYFKPRKDHREPECSNSPYDYLCIGFFRQMGVLFMYTKDYLSLIYLIGQNMAF